MSTDIPNNGKTGTEINLGVAPQDEVISLAGSIAHKLLEDPSAPINPEIEAAATEAAPDAVSLPDMTPEECAEWFSVGNIHNGSHFMSPADNDAYQKLCEADMKKALVFLRNKWSEYADHDFIQSFTLVHWVGASSEGIGELEQLLGDSKHEVEISTQAYKDEQSLKDTQRWREAKFGVVVEGQVNLASNADIQTNQWHGLQGDDATKHRKYTEWANRLMTSETDCVTPYEFVVGDWKAAGIVIDPDTPGIEDVILLAKQHGLPVVDTLHNDLFASK